MTPRPVGGGVKAEKSGKVVVEEGGHGVLEEGEGDMVEANPTPNPPSKLTLPQWLLKPLCPTSAAARRAAVVPWSAQGLPEGCARDQPLFAGASYAHLTL